MSDGQRSLLFSVAASATLHLLVLGIAFVFSRFATDDGPVWGVWVMAVGVALLGFLFLPGGLVALALSRNFHLLNAVVAVIANFVIYTVLFYRFFRKRFQNRNPNA